MTSVNVFSDWLMSLEIFFDKTLYSHHMTKRVLNITFQRLAPYESKENVRIKVYFKGKINI